MCRGRSKRTPRGRRYTAMTHSRRRSLQLLAAPRLGGPRAAYAAPASAPPRLPKAPNCPLFPASNAWNQRVDKLPVAADSARLIPTIGAGTGLHPDFGTAYRDPLHDRRQEHAAHAGSRFDYADESDRGPYPIPANPPIEGGSRPPRARRRPRRLPALRAVRGAPRRRRRLARRLGRDLEPALEPRCARRAGRRPTPPACRSCPGWPATTRSRAGAIRHALRFTVPRTRTAYISPARHYASSSERPGAAADGPARAAQAQRSTIARLPARRRGSCSTALKRYGMILADNGSPWYVTGAPVAAAGTTTTLHALNRVHGSDLEVVAPDTGRERRPLRAQPHGPAAPRQPAHRAARVAVRARGRLALPAAHRGPRHAAASRPEHEAGQLADLRGARDRLGRRRRAPVRARARSTRPRSSGSTTVSAATARGPRSARPRRRRTARCPRAPTRARAAS